MERRGSGIAQTFPFFVCGFADRLFLRSADDGRNSGRWPRHHPGSGGGGCDHLRSGSVSRQDLRQPIELMMPADSHSLLRFEDVSVLFENDVHALDKVSFDVKQGETRIIVGAAGSGKTVLLKAAMGLIKPSSGRIFLFDEDVTDKPEAEFFDLRSKLGMLFQE